jgi:O-antigen/teichoic acid export membrane protein
MGVIIRQSILASVISYVGVIIGYVNILYLYPKFLEVEQVGLLRTIQDAAMLFTPFALFGLGQAVIKYYPHFKADDKQRNAFITLILTFAVFSFGVFLIVFFLFEDVLISFFDKNAAEIIRYIGLILWLTFFLLLINVFEQYSRSLLNIALPAFVREIAIRVLQGILVTVYFLKIITFHQFIVLSVGIYLVALLVLGSYLVLKGGFRITGDFSGLPRPKMKEIFTFSAMSFVGTSAMILIGKMDSVMVTGMIGLASNAIYTNAFYMATVIEIPKRAITTTASPLIASAFERSDIEAVRRLYTRTSINQFIIGSLLLIGVWANIENIFDLMPKGEIYRAGSAVVLIVGAGKLIDMLFGPSSEIIGLSKHYWFNLVVISILAVIVVVANYLLIPSFGIEGAAYGSILALFVYNFTKFIFIYFKLNLQPFSLDTVKVFVICAIVLLVNYALPKIGHPIVDLVIRSAIITIVFGTLVIGSRSSSEINEIVVRSISYIRNRFNQL